jgi:hypothetical protein
VTPDTEAGDAIADRRARPMWRAGLVLLVLVLGLVSFAGLPTSVSVAPLHPGVPASPVHAVAAHAVAPASRSVAPTAAPHPANSSSFNAPCYKIDVGVCVSIATAGESNIIPPIGSFVSAVEPNATTDLPLVIKSQKPLNWTNNAHSGQKSPILLNVSGTLWNGDPFYSINSGDYWHGNNPTNTWAGPTIVSSNKSGYTWWYNVTISAKSATNTRNFFPGETVTWWIELTYNLSFNYIHHESPHFQFTYSGAWPYSPYPGAQQYVGASATFADVNITQTPRSPNWNDSVNLEINTTQADALSNATIGGAYIDLTETSSGGTPLGGGTIVFPANVASNGFGVTTTSVRIPATYAQVEGATVTYRITITDAAADQLVTPVASYVVGGNGSFLSGNFIDDLAIATNPPSVIADATGTAMLNPGQALNVTITSRNLGTAINSAEVIAQVSYPLLHEIVPVTTSLHRVSSTDFAGSLPPLPIGTFVNFSAYAWDFSQRLEVSPQFEYFTPDFATFDPLVEGNSTFFYVFVYDNGSHEWVTGAQVQISGPHGFFNSEGNTTLGVAYPNETRSQFVPLLLPANASYTVTVNDPRFQPVGAPAAPEVNVTVIGYHSMTARQTLVQGPNYLVVQEANALVFWLNTTPPQPQPSPPVPNGSIPVAGLIGVIAASVAAIPLAWWWRQIRARRKEEEKRVTL